MVTQSRSEAPAHRAKAKPRRNRMHCACHSGCALQSGDVRSALNLLVFRRSGKKKPTRIRAEVELPSGQQLRPTRHLSMAMSKENDDLLVHGYGGISANAASSSVSSSSSSSSSFDRIAPAVDGVSNTSDGIPSASPQQLSVQEVQRSKVSQNGSLKQNGTLKLPALSSDNPRSPLLMEQVLPHCCHHCPFHHPFSCPNNQQDCHLVGGSSPATSPLTPCCAHHHSEYPAVRPIHSPVHQTTCCHQPPASFCLHHCWQDHFQHQAIQAHKPIKRPSRSFRFPKSYSELIADWPVIVLGVCTVFIIVCALVGVLVPEFPDFSDPMLGFEPRGTEISQRLTTLDNMRRRTGYKTTLANYPLKYAEMQANR
ncbi:protein dispatched homolog 1 [Polypterus senegalus]|uniref:protein dispatched homolog 1 n=1 Tax=Polypterus senegalus TaxID=55291 RepID=UPI001965850D|nr:protein dispatched homolog 1 [Polypterus senegalus]